MQNVAELLAGSEDAEDEEVVSTSISPVRGRRLTVILVPKVEGDLHRLQLVTNLSPTDLTNRAITMYEFIDARARAGCEILSRDKRTGRTELVEFLGVGGGPGDADVPPPLQGGPLTRPGRVGSHRGHRLKQVEHGRSSGHDRSRNEKGRLRRKLLHSTQLLYSLVERIQVVDGPTPAT